MYGMRAPQRRMLESTRSTAIDAGGVGSFARLRLAQDESRGDHLPGVGETCRKSAQAATMRPVALPSP